MLARILFHFLSVADKNPELEALSLSVQPQTDITTSFGLQAASFTGPSNTQCFHISLNCSVPYGGHLVLGCTVQK